MALNEPLPEQLRVVADVELPFPDTGEALRQKWYPLGGTELASTSEDYAVLYRLRGAPPIGFAALLIGRAVRPDRASSRAFEYAIRPQSGLAISNELPASVWWQLEGATGSPGEVTDFISRADTRYPQFRSDQQIGVAGIRQVLTMIEEGALTGLPRPVVQ